MNIDPQVIPKGGFDFCVSTITFNIDMNDVNKSCVLNTWFITVLFIFFSTRERLRLLHTILNVMRHIITFSNHIRVISSYSPWPEGGGMIK